MTTTSRDTLESWLVSSGACSGGGLPQERDLPERQRVSRGELCKALAPLGGRHCERHADHGTLQRTSLDTEGGNEPIVQHMAEIASPHAAMMARLSLEPELAEHAAAHADPRDLTEARRLANNMRLATNRARDKRLDSRLHELTAVASGNPLLAGPHRNMNAVRISVVRSRPEIPQDRLAPDCHSYVEHDEMIVALERRDRRAEHATMREHLKSTRRF